MNHVGVTFNTDIIFSEYYNLYVLDALVNSINIRNIGSYFMEELLIDRCANMLPAPGKTGIV